MIIQKDRVLAIHIQMEKESIADISRQINELSALINADGGDVVKAVVQKVKKTNSSTLLGSGQPRIMQMLLCLT